MLEILGYDIPVVRKTSVWGEQGKLFTAIMANLVMVVISRCHRQSGLYLFFKFKTVFFGFYLFLICICLLKYLQVQYIQLFSRGIKFVWQTECNDRYI